MPQKFLFETSFDRPEPARRKRSKPAAEPAAPPPPPAVTEDDLAAARQEAFEAGKAEGLREAAEAREAAIAAALEAVAERLGGAGDGLAEAMARHERSCLEAAVRIVRKLFPTMVEREAMGEVEAVIGDCLSRLRDEPRIVIRVADPLLDQLQLRLDTVVAGSGFTGKIVLLSDGELGASDVRVEWADGGAERDVAQTWEEIDALLERALAAPTSANGNQDAPPVADAPERSPPETPLSQESEDEQ